MNRGANGRVLCGVLAIALTTVLGCEPPPPLPSHMEAKSPVGGLRVTYTAQRLRDIGFSAKLVEDLGKARVGADTLTGAYTALVNLWPLPTMTSACEADLKAANFMPMNMKVGFEIEGLKPGDSLVFQVLVGPVGSGFGKLVPSDGTGPTNVKESEPMYNAMNGWAILGGKMPAARGRRSRAGAPGTQFAIELEGTPGGPDEIERYYLLNLADTAKPPQVDVIGDHDAAVVSLVDRDRYIEVGLDGIAKLMPAMGTSGPRYTFRENAVHAADCTGLPGKH